MTLIPPTSVKYGLIRLLDPLLGEIIIWNIEKGPVNWQCVCKEEGDYSECQFERNSVIVLLTLIHLKSFTEPLLGVPGPVSAALLDLLVQWDRGQRQANPTFP